MGSTATGFVKDGADANNYSLSIKSQNTIASKPVAWQEPFSLCSETLTCTSQKDNAVTINGRVGLETKAKKSSVAFESEARRGEAGG